MFSKMADGHKTYSPLLDGTFFEVKEDENGKLLAKCKNCVNKDISGTVHSTSSFLRHLKVSYQHYYKFN